MCVDSKSVKVYGDITVFRLLHCFTEYEFFSGHGSGIRRENTRSGDIPSKNDPPAAENLLIQRQNERSQRSQQSEIFLLFNLKLTISVKNDAAI